MLCSNLQKYFSLNFSTLFFIKTLVTYLTYNPLGKSSLVSLRFNIFSVSLCHFYKHAAIYLLCVLEHSNSEGSKRWNYNSCSKYLRHIERSRYVFQHLHCHRTLWARTLYSISVPLCIRGLLIFCSYRSRVQLEWSFSVFHFYSHFLAARTRHNSWSGEKRKITGLVVKKFLDFTSFLCISTWKDRGIRFCASFCLV